MLVKCTRKWSEERHFLLLAGCVVRPTLANCKHRAARQTCTAAPSEPSDAYQDPSKQHIGFKP